MVWVNPDNYRTSPTTTASLSHNIIIIIINTYEAVTTNTHVRTHVDVCTHHTYIRTCTLASIVSAALALRKLRASGPLISKRRIRGIFCEMTASQPFLW